MYLKRLIVALTLAAVLLPVAVTLVVATGFLFAALQDAAAARGLFAVALAFGLSWVIDLVALLLVLGFGTAARWDGSELPGSGDVGDLDS